jgi:hypothetical protein
MSDTMTVEAVTALLRPMFAEMLRPDELRSLRFRIESGTVWDRTVLDDAATIEPHRAIVGWRILRERGQSSPLRVDEGPIAMVRQVQSELQDFIAESRFGWGELRGPADLP